MDERFAQAIKSPPKVAVVRGPAHMEVVGDGKGRSAQKERLKKEFSIFLRKRRREGRTID